MKNFSLDETAARGLDLICRDQLNDRRDVRSRRAIVGENRHM
jgi:hypothetical protein